MLYFCGVNKPLYAIMENIESYFLENWEKFLGIVIAYLSLIRPIYKYFQDKRKKDRNKRFENYHRLIDELVGGQPGKQVMLDRQIAIIYELRHFKEYFPVTLRILTGLRNTTWQSTDQRLIDEIILTVEYIKASWFGRKFGFINK